MGDHFVLLVDRLLTESTLEAAIQSTNRLQPPSLSVSEHMSTSFSFHRMDINVGSSLKKLEECRICHDEDENSNMEIPCSCRGSLKYAHRMCVQRWCNEKGDTICEICRQQFKPNYTAPPPLFHYGGIPMNFRGNWEISRRDLPTTQFISMDSTDGNFLHPNFDEFPVQTSRSLICCRIIAVIVFISLFLSVYILHVIFVSGGTLLQFMILLVLRHTLPFILYGAGEYSISLFMLLILRTVGIFLPIYIMVKALTAIQRRRNRQDSSIFPLATSNEENELLQLQPETHLIHAP